MAVPDVAPVIAEGPLRIVTATAILAFSSLVAAVAVAVARKEAGQMRWTGLALALGILTVVFAQLSALLHAAASVATFGCMVRNFVVYEGWVKTATGSALAFWVISLYVAGRVFA